MIIDQEDLLLDIHQRAPCLLLRLALRLRACPLVHWLKLPAAHLHGCIRDYRDAVGFLGFSSLSWSRRCEPLIALRETAPRRSIAPPVAWPRIAGLRHHSVARRADRLPW